MSDFAVYSPSVMPAVVIGSFSVRSAVAGDVDGLAKVMAARGGTFEENIDHAQTMIEGLDVLLITEKDEKAVGWCGIQKFAIHQGTDPEWVDRRADSHT